MQVISIDDDNGPEEYVPLKVKRAREEAKLAERKKTAQRLRKQEEQKLADDSTEGHRQESLIDTYAKIKKEKGISDEPDSIAEKTKEEEAFLLEHLNASKMPLGGAKEVAKGVHYSDSMQTSWKPPK